VNNNYQAETAANWSRFSVLDQLAAKTYVSVHQVVQGRGKSIFFALLYLVRSKIRLLTKRLDNLVG
jgi:hypothetical protein